MRPALLLVALLVLAGAAAAPKLGDGVRVRDGDVTLVVATGAGIDLADRLSFTAEGAPKFDGRTIDLSAASPVTWEILAFGDTVTLRTASTVPTTFTLAGFSGAYTITTTAGQRVQFSTATTWPAPGMAQTVEITPSRSSGASSSTLTPLRSVAADLTTDFPLLPLALLVLGLLLLVGSRTTPGAVLGVAALAAGALLAWNVLP